MSKKSAKIAALIESCRGERHDAHYLGYFACFNQGLYYEAHDVLEELWLQDRHGATGNFYKGLIQFAGAFVHMQKHTVERPRLKPAAALLKLARANLTVYPATFYDLNIAELLAMIEHWLCELERQAYVRNPLAPSTAPALRLTE
jgi:predicted metal-dependent hydrolase